jgi:glycosyltransferase involved in cell wall biosynthesis
MFHNIRRLHRLRNYSIIHGFFAVDAGYVAAFAAKILNIPSIVSFRGNDIDKVVFDYAKKPFLNDTLNWATAITYLSEEMLQSLKVVKPDGDYYYTPNSVNREKYRCTDADIFKAVEMKKNFCTSGEKLLGLVGELKFKKGLHFMLKILPELQKIHKTKLLVVGAVNQVDLKLVSDNPDVIYQPYVPASEIVSMYSALDFLVIPSLFEGMPNVMLESMYLGTINIASDIAAMRDVIQDNYDGFKFFPEDSEDFLKVIKHAYSLTDEELTRLKKYAREKAAEYTLERETFSYLNLYNKL